MEKVIIKTCVKKETAKGTFYAIELSDSRKGISSEDLTGKMGMEVELDIKESKPYEGVMQYFFNLPKEQKQNGKFPVKDWSYEKRKESLECAIEFARVSDTKLKSGDVLPVAEMFFTYLNKK